MLTRWYHRYSLKSIGSLGLAQNMVLVPKLMISSGLNILISVLTFWCRFVSFIVARSYFVFKSWLHFQDNCLNGTTSLPGTTDNTDCADATGVRVRIVIANLWTLCTGIQN